MPQGNLIQVRVDAHLKQSAETLFKDLDIDTPTAIRLFLKQSVMRRGIPFSVSIVDDFYSESSLFALNKSIQQLESGASIVKTTDELESMASDE